jgi:membrane-associated phospholipid phosphatase
VGVLLIGWAWSFATPDALDQRLLIAASPVAPHPLFDALMVAITDYSIPYVAVLLACWGLGAEAHARGWIAAQRLFALFAVGGVAVAAIVLVRFGPIYTDPLVPIAMTPVIAIGFGLAGSSFRRLDAAARARGRRIFWLTLLAVLLAELAVELVRALGPGRARPLADGNADWNTALRVIADERVRRGSSFPSGHAAAICALVAPAIWFARGRLLRCGALALAALCVYSRVYLAAHFPSDALAGAAIGVATGALVIGALKPPSSSPSSRHATVSAPT